MNTVQQSHASSDLAVKWIRKKIKLNKNRMANDQQWMATQTVIMYSCAGCLFKKPTLKRTQTLWLNKIIYQEAWKVSCYIQNKTKQNSSN